MLQQYINNIAAIFCAVWDNIIGYSLILLLHYGNIAAILLQYYCNILCYIRNRDKARARAQEREREMGMFISEDYHSLLAPTCDSSESSRCFDNPLAVRAFLSYSLSLSVSFFFLSPSRASPDKESSRTVFLGRLA